MAGPRDFASGQHRHGCWHHRGTVHCGAGVRSLRCVRSTPAVLQVKTSRTVFLVLPSSSRHVSLRGQATLAEIAGTLQVSGDKNNKILTIHDQEGNIREYVVSARAQLLPGVEDGCEVEVGQQLTKGSINPHDLLRLTDPNTTLRYIVSQVQDVYVSQGVDINDKAHRGHRTSDAA